MKTTLDLPDALVDEVQARATREGRQLNDTLVELLFKGLSALGHSAAAPAPKVGTHPESGLPYIECSPDAPARSMTLQRLIALEQEMLDRDDGKRFGLSP